MKMIKKIGLCALLLTIGFGQLAAQEPDIMIDEFRHVPTDLTGSMRPINDNNGEACATIWFNVRDTTFVIFGNLGVLDRKPDPIKGGIRIWVPRGTRRLTIRHNGLFTREYEIPLRIESKMSYHTRLWATKDVPPPIEEPINPPIIEKKESVVIETPVIEKEAEVSELINPSKKPRSWAFQGYTSLGFNALSIMGPSVSFGVDINHHIIELSGVYGIKKTDNLYLYKGDNLIGDYRYRVMRGSLRYGYDIKAVDWVGIMPQVGIALNRFDIDVADVPNNTNKESKYTTSASAFAALRLSFGKRVKFHVTPEYDFGVYKSKHYKLVSEYDDDLKKWTDGFGINAGLILCF